MTKKELLDQIAMLLENYERENDNSIVGAFIDLGEPDTTEWYEFNGERFQRFHGEIDKVMPDGN